MRDTPFGKSSFWWKVLAIIGLGLQIVTSSALEAESDVALTNDFRRGTSTSAYSQSLWKPKVGDSWQIILLAPIKLSTKPLSPDVKVWTLDLFDNDAKSFKTLHNAGKKVICYFSAGSWENWRDDADQFKKSDLGKIMDGWPDERWVDTRSSNVRNIMKKRIALAAKKGCDAIDPDNIDAYGNDNGLKLKKSDAIDYIKFLSKTAAAYNMSIGLKNSAAIIPSVLKYVHFSVIEQCIEYSECDTYAPFIKAGKPVFQIEYPKGAPNKISTATINKICKGSTNRKFTTVMKKMNLDGWVRYCSGKTYTTPVDT